MTLNALNFEESLLTQIIVGTHTEPDSSNFQKRMNRSPPATRKRATSLAVSSGGLIVCGFPDGKVIIYDGSNRRKLTELELGDSVGAISFSPTNWSLLTGSGDRKITFWNKENWARITQLHAIASTSLHYSPNGNSFIASIYDL